MASALSLLLFISALRVQAQPRVRVTLDGKELQFDVPPQILSGRTLVPFRGIFEAVGASVEWNEAARTVTAVRGDKSLKLTLDKRVAEWGRSIIEVDVAPTVIDGRTMVPLRFIGQALGIWVDWEAATNTVLLETQPKDRLLAQGVAIVHTKNCMVCHSIHGVGGKVGPRLNGVTDRYSHDWLRKWLKDPQSVRSGSRMPNFGFSDDEIEAVIRYLETAN